MGQVSFTSDQLTERANQRQTYTDDLTDNVCQALWTRSQAAQRHAPPAQHADGVEHSRDTSFITRSVNRRASASQAGVAQMKRGSKSVMTGSGCVLDVSSMGVLTISQACWSHVIHIKGLASRIISLHILLTETSNSRCLSGSAKPALRSSG